MYRNFLNVLLAFLRASHGNFHVFCIVDQRLTMKKSDKPLYTNIRNVMNKATLLEPIVRHLVQDSLFYKQHLYMTNEETILPVIVEEVHYVGGINANGRPSPFLCCLLRLLEIEPKKEVIDLCLDQLNTNSFKYMTALYMLYVRMVWESADIYKCLERFYSDRRKIRILLKSPILKNGTATQYDLSYIDSWVDNLLHDTRVVDTILPRLLPREPLQMAGILAERHYYLDEFEGSESSESDSDSDFYSD